MNNTVKSAPPDASAAAPTRRQTIALLLAICLPAYAVFAISKFIEMSPAWLPDIKGLLSYPIDLFTYSFQDLIYVLAIAAIAYFPLRWSVHKRGVSRAIWVSLIAFMFLNVIYAVVNIKLYSFLGTPLTLPLLRMAGDVKSMRESTGTFITPGTIALLTLMPLGYLLAVWIVAKTRVLERPHVRRALVIIFVLYCIGEPYSYWRRIANTSHELFARNIVCHFAMSCSARLTGSESAALGQTPPPQYFADFETFAQRPGPAFISPGSHPKNVIVLVLESVNAMYTSVYGGKYATTPHLQEAAKHALVFDNAYAHAGYTAHSMISLAMSMYSGMGWRIYVEDYPRLPGVTMAQVLKTNGFRTAFMTSQDLDFQSMRRFLTGRGFDDIKDFKQLGSGARLTGWGGADRDLVTGLLSWIDENPSQPFYALTWTQQTHHPYQLAPGETSIDFVHDDSTQRTRELNRFLSALHVGDEQFQRLLDGLKERKLLDDTLIVVTGDHGEAFGSPHKWYSHGTSLYEENVHVPMLFINAKRFDPGRRSSVVGGHIDMNPTICDLLGISPPPVWQGTSLLDPAHPSRAYFATVAASYLMGMREGNWKFIYNATFAREELYDLSSDPTEQHNVFAGHADVCNEFRGRLSAWVQFEKRHMDSLLAQTN